MNEWQEEKLGRGKVLYCLLCKVETQDRLLGGTTSFTKALDFEISEDSELC